MELGLTRCFSKPQNQPRSLNRAGSEPANIVLHLANARQHNNFQLTRFNQGSKPAVHPL